MTADLTPAQRHILEEKGTEPPFSGALLHNNETGVYSCAGCGNQIFSSDAKFESNSGWPSFSQVMSSDAVNLSLDLSHGLVRTEVTCAKCGGHLGHMFGDGTKENCNYFCINSLALDFKKKLQVSHPEHEKGHE